MGGDGHGHGHDEHRVKIPDYKIYKVDDAPELVKVRDALAKRGLKDPWLRNEVWRFNPEIFGTKSQRRLMVLGRGFKLGVSLFALNIIAEKAYEYAYPPEPHHGHH